MFATMFSTKSSLMSTLLDAKRQDPECISFCNKIHDDIREMEQEEITLRDWVIPSHIPKDVILETVRKQNNRCLRFTLELVESEPWKFYILRMCDPRPRNNWKHGYDAGQYRWCCCWQMLLQQQTNKRNINVYIVVICIVNNMLHHHASKRNRWNCIKPCATIYFILV